MFPSKTRKLELSDATLQESPDYDTVQNLEYLDMVLCEALRLYPPAFRYETSLVPALLSQTLILFIDRMK